MKKFCFLFIITLLSINLSAQDGSRKVVEMKTTMGKIVVELYNETPLHRDNFISLVGKHYYDGLLFHRVIQDFMIQGGDPNSRNAQKGQELGDGDEHYKVPSEICFPTLFHKYGALAAAREPDNVNPNRDSSASQFYIVVGQKFNNPMLDRVQERIDKATDGTIKLTDDIREVYKTLGGTPHLDGQYTVFGEVVEGMDVVEKIQKVATDGNDRPIDDVRILTAKVVERN